MSRFKRHEVVQFMGEQGMVPVFYHPDVEIVRESLKAYYEGGGRIFEFTNRGDFAHEVFAEVSRWVATELPDMMLGTGSVIEAGTASLYMQLGSAFIVSPVLKEDMAICCNRRKVAWVPGCGTASEISHAEELGADIVKIFPGASVGGPGFVKAFLGPSPWSLIMPTGGVEPTEESLTAWFKAGVYCVGMGSQLITSDIIKNRNFDLLREKTKETLELIRSIKKR
jgi:2-dehydro-3-deoxyphosphogluconate aldolase / (4S)-4-hydroxy-2-oxoglutarate aldolase